jgi:hypothetical protein
MRIPEFSSLSEVARWRWHRVWRLVREGRYGEALLVHVRMARFARTLR